MVRKTSVAFRSAKDPYQHSFAERKTTIKARTVLNSLSLLVVLCLFRQMCLESSEHLSAHLPPRYGQLLQ